MSNLRDYDSGNDSDEFELLENERLEKWDAIKHFTVSDYFSCKETKQTLKEHWANDFEPIENELYEIFDDYLFCCRERDYDMLALCDDVHRHNFVSLVKHHVKRQYNLKIFEDDPDLAKPLVEQLDDIRRAKKEKRQEALKQQFKKSNKTFDWNTKKYV